MFKFSGQPIEEAFIHGYMTSDGMDQCMFVLSCARRDGRSEDYLVNYKYFNFDRKRGVLQFKLLRQESFCSPLSFIFRIQHVYLI